MNISDSLHTFITMTLGAVWLIAAMLKSRNINDFSQSISKQIETLSPVSNLVAISMLTGEAIVGLFLLFDIWPTFALSASTTLLVILFLLTIRNANNALGHKCHCFGQQDQSTPRSSLIRTGFLMMISISLLAILLVESPADPDRSSSARADVQILAVAVAIVFVSISQMRQWDFRALVFKTGGRQ